MALGRLSTLSAARLTLKGTLSFQQVLGGSFAFDISLSSLLPATFGMVILFAPSTGGTVFASWADGGAEAWQLEVGSSTPRLYYTPFPGGHHDAAATTLRVSGTDSSLWVQGIVIMWNAGHLANEAIPVDPANGSPVATPSLSDTGGTGWIATSPHDAVAVFAYSGSPAAAYANAVVSPLTLVDLLTHTTASATQILMVGRHSLPGYTSGATAGPYQFTSTSPNAGLGFADHRTTTLALIASSAMP